MSNAHMMTVVDIETELKAIAARIRTLDVELKRRGLGLSWYGCLTLHPRDLKSDFLGIYQLPTNAEAA